MLSQKEERKFLSFPFFVFETSQTIFKISCLTRLSLSEKPTTQKVARFLFQQRKRSKGCASASQEFTTPTFLPRVSITFFGKG